MLGSGARLLGGTGWDGYNETREQINAGGLLPFQYEDEDEEEEEEEAPEAMDQGSDDDQKDEEAENNRKKQEATNIDTTMVIYPSVIVNKIVHYDKQVFGWPITGIPTGLGSIAPQTLQALPNTDPVLLEIQGLACCLVSVLPGIVHGSPMEALLSTAAACFAAIKAGQTLAEVIIPERPRYVSWLQSAVRLHQLRKAVLEGVVPFHESVQALTIKRHDLEYKHQLRLACKTHDARLDVLYTRGAMLADHVSAWWEHSLLYLHLMEHFLWDCLVAPYPMCPPLENVLTPTELVSLDICPELTPQLLRDVATFFKDKRDRAPDHGLADPATIVGLLQAKREPAFQGWAPLSYLESYRIYLQDGEYNGVLE